MSDERGRPPGGSRGTTRLVLIGLLGFPVVVWGLAARLELPLGDALFLAFLLEALPVLAVAQMSLVEDQEVRRSEVYLSSLIVLSLLGAFALGLGLRRFGVSGLGLSLPTPAGFTTWAIGLTAASALVVALAHGVRKGLGLGVHPILRRLIPSTRDEKRLFVGLSLAAGFGEELAFRAYAITSLAPHLGGPWSAAVFTSVVFGLLHAYQGGLGMVRAAAIGFVLAGGFVLGGNVWAPIAAHVAIDLFGGLAWGDRLTRD